MKCRRHPYELGVGVCASCLRERLLALIAIQSGRSPDPEVDVPPRLAFPRSVSPSHASHRRSLGSGGPARPHCRFFSTPQVGPAANSERSHYNYSYSLGRAAAAAPDCAHKDRSKRFSLLSVLFGYPKSDEIKSKSKSKSSSSSWISGLFPGRRKKAPKTGSARSKSLQDQGMSPAKDECDGNDDSPCFSGYSTESPAGWRRPEPTPVRKFPSSTAKHHGRAVSGFTVCLSPLVRPTSKPAADLGVAGDLHHHHRRHVSSGANSSLVQSRSRKLADYGRFR